MIVPTKSTAQLPFDRMHWLLDKAENTVGALERNTTADAVGLLQMLDEIETIYSDLTSGGVDLRGEEARLETMHLTLQRKAGTLLRLLRPKGGMAGLRSLRPAPPQESWWWYLDDYVTRQRQRQIRGTITGVVTIIVVLVIATVIYNRFLSPSPELIARMDAVNAAQNAVEQNDLNGALVVLDKAVIQFPDNGDILLWHGAILTRLNRQPEAQASFDAARATYASEIDYLVNKAQIRLQAGDMDGGYADAQQAIKVAPDSAQAYLTLGGAQEVLGLTSAAVNSYNMAASLAGAQKNTQLEAVAKVRMAMLMQSAPVFPQSSPRPTP
jgi:tetratricopeptide (TPR) repeat protein